MKKKQNNYNELTAKINSLSISIRNFDQNKDKFTNKVKNIEFNPEINTIIKKNMDKQKSSEEKEEMILMNPSKSFKEIHKEKVTDTSPDKIEKKKESGSKLKNIVMYLGSQFFIKDPNK